MDRVSSLPADGIARQDGVTGCRSRAIGCHQLGSAMVELTLSQRRAPL